MDKDIEKFEKLAHSQELYNCAIPELVNYQATLVNKIREYNLTPETEEGYKQRTELLKEMLGTYSEGVFILPPVYANFGLKHVHMGKNVYVNFHVTFIDDDDIFIGDNVMIAPNVTIITATHPINPNLRKHSLQYNKPVHIKDNVWIGASVTILPGVTIGENSVIGAGSVITKDVEPNSIIVGNPGHLLRKIEDYDMTHFDKREIDKEILDKYK